MKKIKNRNEFYSCRCCGFTEMRMVPIGQPCADSQCPQCGESGAFGIAGVKHVCPKCSGPVKLLMTQKSLRKEFHTCGDCRENFILEEEEVV